MSAIGVLKNNTDIPDTLIREMAEFVAPVGVEGVNLEVRNVRIPKRRQTLGKAYYPPYDLVRIYLTINEDYAKTRLNRDGIQIGRGYMDFSGEKISGRQELLLTVLAHEFRHLYQRLPGANMIGGNANSKRRFVAERDAELYAKAMLGAWRNRTV